MDRDNKQSESQVTHKIESQIAVWAPGPTTNDEDRLFLVLDIATGVLSARVEKDRFDQTSGTIQSSAEEIDLTDALKFDEPSLFARKLREKLDQLMTDL